MWGSTYLKFKKGQNSPMLMRGRLAWVRGVGRFDWAGAPGGARGLQALCLGLSDEGPGVFTGKVSGAAD